MLDTTPLDALAQTILARRVPVADALEGCRDYKALELNAATREAVNAMEAELQERDRRQTEAVDRLVTAIKAVADLDRDGFPDLPKFAFTQAVVDELRDQPRTILAALSLVEAQTPEPSASMIVAEIGEPVDAP